MVCGIDKMIVNKQTLLSTTVERKKRDKRFLNFVMNVALIQSCSKTAPNKLKASVHQVDISTKK